MKSSALYYLIKSLFKLLSLLSIANNHRLGAFIGWLFYISHSKFRYISEINIRLCFPKLSVNEQKELLKQNMYELGKSMTELAFVWTWPIPKLLSLINFTGVEKAQQAIKQGQGVIILTPHLGCWEMAPIYLAQHLPLTVFYKSAKIAGVNRIIHEARERPGAELVKDDRRGLVTLLKRLKNANATGILPDQTPKDKSSGTFASFFGHQVLTINLISNLALKTEAKVFIGYAKRLPQGKGYEFKLESVADDFYSKDEFISANALNKEVENCVLQAPEQYLWSYKRFKQVPEGHQAPY